MAEFLLPDLGEGLEEAQLVQWLVRVGDRVALNQPLCQVETAKALVDVPSPFAGIVERLHAEPGDSVLVGHPLVTITRAGEESSTGDHQSEGQADGGHGPVLVGYGTDGPTGTFSRRRRTTTTAPVLPSAVTAVEEPSGGRASPLVRKIAAEKGIDLLSIRGTGPGGRIRVEDLETARSEPSAVAVSTAPLAEDEERISTVGLRKTIAARMLKAATTIPHFTEYGLFDAFNLVALRSRLREEPAYAGEKLTYLPFFVRALVRAVEDYPIMNSRWDEQGNAIIVKRSIHVGLATDTPRGLLVPVLRDAQKLSLRGITAESGRLIGRTRDGSIDARSLTGGTITITNVGAAGPVDTGAPLINPPEACVVGFGAIKPRPTVVGDTVQARPGAWISISCDHRIVDGATAAQFMGALVARLENPDQLL
jgi:pyruvate dehydrogenase E2 component (dihydrolipoamide acetyltransferase)